MLSIITAWTCDCGYIHDFFFQAFDDFPSLLFLFVTYNCFLVQEIWNAMFVNYKLYCRLIFLWSILGFVTKTFAVSRSSAYDGYSLLLEQILQQEEVNSNKGGEIIDNTSNNHHIVIKWNPMTMIRKYRNTGDLFCQLELHVDLYALVLGKYYPHTKYFLKIIKKCWQKHLILSINIGNRFMI